MWKLCSKCKKHKALWEFHKCKGNLFGVRDTCKVCRSIKYKQHYIDNKEYIISRCKQYVLTNPDKRKTTSKKYYDNNKDKLLASKRRWRKDNPDKVLNNVNKRRAMKLNQTPELTQLEKDTILYYYKISNRLGSAFHVDHIKPLSKGGLHHPDNLQVIPAEHNLRKSNNEEYEIPRHQILRISYN